MQKLCASHTGYGSCEASACLEPVAPANAIHIRDRVRADRIGAIDSAVLERKERIGSWTIDHVREPGRVARKALVGGGCSEDEGPYLIGECIIESIASIELQALIGARFQLRPSPNIVERAIDIILALFLIQIVFKSAAAQSSECQPAIETPA